MHNIYIDNFSTEVILWPWIFNLEQFFYKTSSWNEVKCCKNYIVAPEFLELNHTLKQFTACYFSIMFLQSSPQNVWENAKAKVFGRPWSSHSLTRSWESFITNSWIQLMKKLSTFLPSTDSWQLHTCSQKKHKAVSQNNALFTGKSKNHES